MKLSEFDSVVVLIRELKELKDHITNIQCARSNYLGITLQGKYQDKSFVDKRREVVLIELRTRLQNVERVARIGSLG